jgi:S-adenosylmethionine:tRNA ribosyltransferase-isomerase
MENRRIIGVGTTSVRSLESFSDDVGKLVPQAKWVDTFIYPGIKFKVVDAMITNFHLPKSTLLMLLAAFLAQNKKPQDGIEIFQRLYKEAIKNSYRFYSYGDGMLIF